MTGLSAIIISPSVSFSKPAISLSSVDFPQPEGPTKTTNSPFSIDRCTSFITSVFPKDLSTFLSSTCAMLYLFKGGFNYFKIKFTS